MAHNRAVFLDRDGTLNRDDGYIHKPEEWTWLPEVFVALRLLQKHGWLLVVASNQSGINRGFYTRDQLKALENHCRLELKAEGVNIDNWYYCPHVPGEGCNCRKPLPGMLLQASIDLDICLEESWMIGDKLRDVEAGLSAKCRSILLSRDPSEEEMEARKYKHFLICPDLLAASTIIIQSS